MNAGVSEDSIKQIYEEMTKEATSKVELNDMLEMSRALSDDIKIYKHCDY